MNSYLLWSFMFKEIPIFHIITTTLHSSFKETVRKLQTHEENVTKISLYFIYCILKYLIHDMEQKT